MKLVSYNVENLFLRVRAMNESSGNAGSKAIKVQQRLNALFARKAYSAADKKEILVGTEG